MKRVSHLSTDPTFPNGRAPFLRRLTRRVGAVLAAMVGLLVISTVVVINGCATFGGKASGARRARMERSPQWKDGHFENPEPLINDMGRALRDSFDASPDTNPASPVPATAIDPRRFQTPPPSGLRVTWLGHSALLVEIDGHRVLTDPVWSERASPFDWIGPQRWYAPLIPLGTLPGLDAVVISHDHYDHLDHRTIVAMKDWPTTFVVPLGVAAHLIKWGVPESRIVELDWWERTKVRGLEIVCTPARHASGRTMLFDKDATLWAGYALIGERHRAYYSGDTGLFPAMRDIGARLGPFDVTMIETGQYHPAWPDWHIGPEQAVHAHRLVRGRVLLPVHWGLFRLAYHAWTEPPERAHVAALKTGATITVPRPGESIEPAHAPAFHRWWPELKWTPGESQPIVSSKVDPTLQPVAEPVGQGTAGAGPGSGAAAR
jgi:L-ascorbate metabolism protein UlaG (beta-lactamase superfamily)